MHKYWGSEGLNERHLKVSGLTTHSTCLWVMITQEIQQECYVNIAK
jgi:hypothetical protein